MEKEIAIELLKIAAQLTETAIANKVVTASREAHVRPFSTEAVFEDCLKAVQAHFADMT